MLNEQNIKKLRKELITLLEQYNGKEKIKLNISPELLNQLIFDGSPTFKYIAIYPSELWKKLDLTDACFDNVKVYHMNFKGSYGVKINPQTVFGKNLDSSRLDDTEITGSFTGCSIFGTSYNGKLIKELNMEELREQEEYQENLTLISESFKMK